MNAPLLAWHLLREARVVTRRRLVRALRGVELGARGRAELWAILSAEVRRRAGLRAIAEALGERRLRPDVADFAHVGLAQLLFVTAVPSHAAIAETVEAARTALGERPASAVNGFLRRVQREIRRGSSGDRRRDIPLTDIHFDVPVFADPDAHWLLWAEQALSLPVPIGRRWRNRWGVEAAERLARSAILAPDLSLYVARGTVEAARVELAACQPRSTSHPRILLASASARGTLLAAGPVRRGDVAILGETAARAAELLAARPGERVLDLRAASRAAHPVLACSGAAVETRRAPDLGSADFDASFLTAPSSATGVLSARPGARWTFDATRTQALAARQKELLTLAAAAVRPGGRLVYATRSIEPDENERRVRAFLDAQSGWSLESELRALPGEHEADGPVDGGYAARLVRS